MRRLFSVVLIPLLALPAFSPANSATPQYSIHAIRYASADDEVADLASPAADEAGGHRVGVDERGLRIERWQPIGAHQVTQDVVALPQAGRRVCADVVQQPDAHAAQGAYVTDPALLPSPYETGWMLNRIADLPSDRKQ